MSDTGFMLPSFSIQYNGGACPPIRRATNFKPYGIGLLQPDGKPPLT